MSAHKWKSKNKQRVSADLNRNSSVFVDLLSISKHTMAVSSIKWMIKESLVIQISHTHMKWCLKVAWGTRWWKPF